VLSINLALRQTRLSSVINQSINIRLFDGMIIITTDTNAIVIYIASPGCSNAKYPECPATNDPFIELNF